MNRSPCAAALAGAFLWVLAFGNLFDLYSPFDRAPRELKPLSAADREGKSLSSRERGTPAFRRGALHLPDLFPYRIDEESGAVRTMELKADVPDGSWFDLLIDSGSERSLTVRIATNAEGSFVAEVPGDIAAPPREEPIGIAPECFRNPVVAVLQMEGRTAGLSIGGCPPVSLERGPEPGALGFASGLAGAKVLDLKINKDEEAGAGERVLLRHAPPMSRFVRASGAAAGLATALALAASILGRLRRGRLKEAPLRRIAAFPALAVAAVPGFPPAVALMGVTVAAFNWFALEGRGEREKAKRRGWGLTGILSFITVAALAPAVVLMVFPAKVSPGDEVPVQTLADMKAGAAPFGAPPGGLIVEAEPPSDGAYRVLWGLDAAQPPDRAMRPLVYPDLGLMPPSLLLESVHGATDWRLMIGDVTARYGTFAGEGAFRVVHARGVVRLEAANETLAVLRGVPAHGGAVRALQVMGRPEMKVRARAAGGSRAMEIYAGLGPALFWTALALLLSRATGKLMRESSAVFGFPFYFLLAVFLLNLRKDVWNLAAVSWSVVPAFIALACLYQAVRSVGAAFKSPLPAAVCAAVFLVLPSLLLPVAGGPAWLRLARPWHAGLRTASPLPVLDPDSRLFNDTALTGLYHNRVLESPFRPGNRRLLVLGGSQTYGEGFAGPRPPEIWTTALEESVPGLEVVNLGVEGSTLSSQALRLRGYLQSGGTADAIAAVFGMNDGTLLRRSNDREKKIAASLAGRPPWSADPCGTIAACSVARGLVPVFALFSGRGTGTAEERNATLSRAVGELSALSEEYGLDLYLAREPQQCDLTRCEGKLKGYDLPHGFDAAAAAIEEARAGGARVLDFRERFHEHRARIPFFDFVHFSEEGHRMMAHCLKRELE